jgi:DNA-binding CsgD family transcriptional regulator
MIAGLSGYALTALFAHWAVLWLGMDLLGRRPRTSVAIVTGLAFITCATFLLEVAYYYIPTTVAEAAQREKWLASWAAFCPALFVHGYCLLIGARSIWHRVMIIFSYAFAVAAFIGRLFNGVFIEFESIKLDQNGYVSGILPGRFYWVMALQMVLTTGLALAILLHARFAGTTPARAVRSQLNMLTAGTGLVFASAVMLALDGFLPSPVPDALLLPIGIVGAVMIALPLVRYQGRLGGQLLRLDIKTSLLITVLMMTAFMVIAMLAHATMAVVACTGWLVLVPVVLGDDLRDLADRFFYGRAARAARAGLRTAEAYAGSSRTLDVDALTTGGSTEFLDYLSDLDRAGLGSDRHGPGPSRPDGDWLKLLAREEFAHVRDALGAPKGWSLGQELPIEEIRRQAAIKLEPRERQALGLWYMGHSDKDMARLMGVRPGVPRSYLSEGKKKLGLVAGPPLTLFVHFAGFVGSDALPLLQPGPVDL